MSLFQNIRTIVKQIPKGKVTTYGTIAHCLGTGDARKVGWAVWGNKNPLVPCHRVVMKDGFLAEKYSLGGWEEQKQKLEAEGITFIGKNQVDLTRHYWQPA